MEEKTKLLICLGAATAANCVPCFEYYFCEAKVAKLAQEEIQLAVDLADKVKQGAFLALKNNINEIMGLKEQLDLPCRGQSGSSCSG
jgi:hypothetical protein